MSWKLEILFDDGTSEVVDEDFETEEDAEEEYDLWLEGYSAGREVLELAGESYCEHNIEDCVIWEDKTE